jgi:hypothetical protein
MFRAVLLRKNDYFITQHKQFLARLQNCGKRLSALSSLPALPHETTSLLLGGFS